METIDNALAIAVDYAWGLPLLVALLGVGGILTFYSRLIPFRYMRHAVEILRGKYDRDDAPGDIDHFQALSTALASTLGMGNIGGVAIAITQGGPGAIFWMWVAAVVGMATKFFTCTLAVMYRGKDSEGKVQGGPMYYIEVGLGKRWRWLAVFFSVFGMIGCLAMFQSNQMAEILRESYDVPGWVTGVFTLIVVGAVILGGIGRIATVASRLVPAMCIVYLVMAVTVVAMNIGEVPAVFARIFHDAFSGTAASGGAAGIAWITVIQTGIKRAAFSNEAGIGTAAMAHGAAKTDEPVREGLVAMLGPFIDTILVCTLTAIVVLLGADWQGEGVRGASLTSEAFGAAMGPFGEIALMIVVVMFAMTTMFGYSYYGRKCFSYLFGAKHGRIYDGIYLVGLFIGAVWSADIVVNLLDTSFAMMAFPNLLAAAILAPRVMAAARDYFDRFSRGETSGQPNHKKPVDLAQK
ncbi:MAG: AGCS family alanine or glycine:cation symporter [Myxococcota bacterium]|jgi:AGCS family alanine or glycine:cation symporter